MLDPDLFPPRELPGKERWGLHVGLAAITIGLMWWGHHWLFPVALFSILFAHEMGHYIACKIYGVNASPPYFIPGIPAALLGFDFAPGTFGAFIRIRQPIPSRRALFDIGIAGPLAGFAVLLLFLPTAVQELRLAAPLSPLDGENTISDPLIVRWLVPITRGFAYDPRLQGGPIYAAIWVGCLVTMLNLFPIGQLDGGHIVYALFGKRYNRYARPMLLLMWLIVILAHGSFFVMAVLVTLIGPRHPPVLREEHGIGTARKLVAIVGLVVFVVCLNPLLVTETRPKAPANPSVTAETARLEPRSR